jgi:conjugative relaxase-like TrwC/TraI family protein
VLSAAPLTPDRAAYLERTVASGREDYYTGRGESEGRYHGALRAELGLGSRPLPGELEALIAGRHPTLPVPPLLRRPAPRIELVPSVDPQTGERVTVERERRAVGGWDFVFSAPKSISLAHSLAESSVRRELRAAHEAAVRGALDLLEAEACFTRRGTNGVERVRGVGIIAALYTHRTSRALDPQLHTHAAIINLTRARDDSTWRTLDSATLLRRWKLTLGYAYQAHLRHEVARRLGWEFNQPVDGLAELRGFDPRLLRAFSQRRSQIEHELAGRSSWRASQAAALRDRPRKLEPHSLGELEAAWRQRASEHGLSPRGLARLLRARPHGRSAEIDQATLERLLRRLASASGVCEKRTTFGRAEAARHAAGLLREGAPALGLPAITDALLAREDLILRLDADTATTRELAASEQAYLRLVEQGRDAGVGMLTGAAVGRALEGADLSAEQAGVVRAVASSGHAIENVEAAAGSGKTTTAAVIAAAYREAGWNVIGTAPTARAARELGERGIPSHTNHRLLHHPDLIPPAPLLVLADEAGMSPTREHARLLAVLRQQDAKIVQLGDSRQLASTQAGGAFADTTLIHGARSLNETHRQRDPAEVRALNRLRSGDSLAYLAHKAQRSELRVAHDSNAAIDQAAAWWQDRAQRHGSANVLILSRSRALAQQTNESIRMRLVAEQRLGEDALTAGGIELRVGDRVVCRRNQREHDLQNGTRGTITHLDRRTRSVVLGSDDGRQLALPASYLDQGHAQHAYAVTTHLAQGATVEAALVLVHEDATSLNHGYTAASRARHETLQVVIPNDLQPAARDQRVSLANHAERLARRDDPHLAVRTLTPSRAVRSGAAGERKR